MTLARTAIAFVIATALAVAVCVHYPPSFLRSVCVFFIGTTTFLFAADPTTRSPR